MKATIKLELKMNNADIKFFMKKIGVKKYDRIRVSDEIEYQIDRGELEWLPAVTSVDSCVVIVEDEVKR